MRFFSEWLISRLGETGWPKSNKFLGLFNQRYYYTEESIVKVMRDVVRVAIAIGSAYPDAAKGIAITYNRITPDTTRDDIDEYINYCAAQGNKKWVSEQRVRPLWLRLCSLILHDNQGTEIITGWAVSSHKYYVGTPETLDALQCAETSAIAAMLWGLLHSNQADLALDDIRNWGPDLETGVGDVTVPLSRNAWLSMAQRSISAFGEVLTLPSYSDKETWHMSNAWDQTSPYLNRRQ